jgi:hypothetical protein
VAISIVVVSLFVALGPASALAGPASTRPRIRALAGRTARSISVSAATRPGRDGALSTTVSGEGAGSVLVALLSVAATGPGVEPPAPRLRPPSTPGLEWRMSSVTSDAGASVGIWQTTLGSGRIIRVHAQVQKDSKQALLAVAQFPAGSRVIDGPGAGQNGRGLPTFRVHAAAGEQVLAIGHAWLGAHALRPAAGQTVVAHVQTPAQQTWVQALTATRTGSVKFADQGPSTRGWVLSGIVVRPPASTVATDR